LKNEQNKKAGSGVMNFETFLRWLVATFFVEIAVLAYAPYSITGYDPDGGKFIPGWNLIGWFVGIFFALNLAHIIGNIVEENL
jgi:hypothetical protein